MKPICYRALAVLLPLILLFVTVPPTFAKDPIKIGFMAPYTGTFAKSAKDMDNGFRLALEEAGYKAGGRQLVMITEDDQAKPEMGPTKARKLIENDKVSIIAGILNSGIAAAVRDSIINSKTPLMITNAGTADLTGKLKSPYIFRSSFANGQQEQVAGWYAYNRLGYKRIVIIAADQIAGHEKAEAFLKYFKASGGQVVTEMYPPVQTTDFGPYLTQISAVAKSADAVWTFFPDSGGIRLVNQYAEYGLKDRLPLFTEGGMMEDTFLRSMKDNALGIKNYNQYADTLKTPENEKFVKAYRAKYNDYPSSISEQGYVGAKAIILALNAVNGDIENKDAFLAVLRRVKFNAPRGVFAFDANQNAVFPLFIRVVDKIEGRYASRVLDTVPNVEQNWSPDKMKK